MSFKLVIFDCDGVLVDSESLSSKVFAEELCTYGYQISGDDFVRQFRGIEFAKILETLQLKTNINLPDSFETDLRSRMSVVFKERLKPVDGAHRLVESMNVPFCVASSGPRKKIEENLKTTGLYPHFADKIFSAYEVKSWKPDPGLFLAAATHFGIAPQDCAVLEDSAVGIRAALSAGMTAFGLSATENKDSVVAAERVFPSLDDVHSYFATLGLTN